MILASYDLDAWEPLAIIQTVDELVEFLDPEARDLDRRFYRAVIHDPDRVPKVQVTDIEPDQLQLDAFDVTGVTLAGETLTANVNYSGGCADHFFTMFMSPATFMESEPVQANLSLRHRDLDDPCDSIVGDTVRFDIGPVLELMEMFYGRRDSVILNVHGYTGSQELSILYEP